MLHEADKNCFILTGTDKCYRKVYELIIKKCDDTKQNYSLKDILVENRQEYTGKSYANTKREDRYGHRRLIVNKAYCILGFIRFLKGYYIILVTKRKRVAKIMRHSIYTIKDMVLVPLYNNTTSQNRDDENRYINYFQ